MKTLKDFDFKNKRVLLRCDFNVPIVKGKVQDDFRIKASLPTINFLLEKGAKLLLISHLEDAEGKNLSLAPVKIKLEEYLGRQILMAEDCIGEKIKNQISNLKNGEILLLENLRFHKEEKENSPNFAKQLARLGDIYINDAFSVCHRVHASVVGLPQFLPSGVGFLLEKEIKVLSTILENPQRPLVVIIGGAKISSKAGVIKNFLEKADNILLGGKVANTILQIKGFYRDLSLDKEELEDLNFDLNSPKIHLPVDFIKQGDLIFDIGQETIKNFSEIIKTAKMTLWSGPMGFFEKPEFENGTKMIGLAIIKNKETFKVAGGGDTISAISRFGLLEKFDHISTGGGAMLEFLAGKKLAGIKALERADLS